MLCIELSHGSKGIISHFDSLYATLRFIVRDTLNRSARVLLSKCEIIPFELQEEGEKSYFNHVSIMPINIHFRSRMFSQTPPFFYELF